MALEVCWGMCNRSVDNTVRARDSPPIVMVAEALEVLGKLNPVKDPFLC